MKNFFLSCTIAAISLTMPAFADCCYSAPCDPCYPNFNGFYVGGNLGIYSNTLHRNDFDGFFTAGGTRSINTTNFTAGVQVGYDWMCSNHLFGVVADWNWINNNHNYYGAFYEGSCDNLNWFTTIRGRTGVTVCDALVYVTIGAAVFGHDNRSTGLLGALDFSQSFTRWGWCGGVGTEFLMGCNWSFGAEFLVLNFSNHNRDISGVSGAGVAGIYTLGFSDTAYLGRILLNYRFGDLFGF